jgi:hypothetical protein
MVADCGKQLNAFRLILLEAKFGPSGMRRAVSGDVHGRFSFPCTVEPICGDEPFIEGFFVSAERWNKSSKDEQAIYQTARSVMAIGWSFAGDPQPQMPAAACPVFDGSVDGTPARAVCFDVTEGKAGNMVVVVVAGADDHLGVLLSFRQQDRSAIELRDEVLEILPRFKIERANGDSALLSWFR